jgi:hypothetical protein
VWCKRICSVGGSMVFFWCNHFFCPPPTFPIRKSESLLYRSASRRHSVPNLASPSTWKGCRVTNALDRDVWWLLITTL